MTDIKPLKNEKDFYIRNCENICRICLSFTDLLLPIFKGEGMEQNLEVKIQKYLPVSISVSDSLPQQLCFQCADALISWDSLINICLESDQKLKCFLGQGPLVGEETKVESLCEKVMNGENDSTEVVDASNLNDSTEVVDASSLNDSVAKKKKFQPKPKRKLTSAEEVPKMEVEVANAQPEIKTEVPDSVDEQAVRQAPDAEKEEQGLTCEYCGDIFNGKKLLAQHIKTHKQSKLMEAQKCDLCPNVYKTRANLEKHYAKEHVDNQVECPVCHASVHSKKLESHLKTIHGVKTTGENGEKFKCKYCEKWFKNKYIRNSHVKEIHLSEPVKCKLCDFRGVRNVLRRHRTEVHSEKRFPCSLCNAAFKTLHTLKTHMTSHSDLRSFICDICGMRFKRLNNVRDHMKCHEQKSNQCQICGNFFARKRYLAIHEKTIHNFYADGIIPEEKGFECEICGSKLKWKKNLLAHMRIHTREKPYACKICKKDFVCHGSLRTHMSKHGVCASKENDILSTAAQAIQDPQTNHSVNIGLFGHFNI